MKKLTCPYCGRTSFKRFSLRSSDEEIYYCTRCGYTVDYDKGENPAYCSLTGEL